MSILSSTDTDWPEWYSRWEAQQQQYMPDREVRFEVIADAVQAVCGEAPHIVDLGCGPGSLAKRLLDRLPGARITAIDMDPVLLAIGRGAFGDYGGRLQFVDADLRSNWETGLQGPVDAAVSTTALHWLTSDALAALYVRLAATIRPGGLFVDGDHIGFGAHHSQIAAAVAAIRARRRAAEPVAGGAEDWDQWWAAVEREPGLAAEVEERHRRQHDHPDHDHAADLQFHVDALSDAGFAEVDTLWQQLTDRVLAAVR